MSKLKMKTIEVFEKPKGYEDDLSDYGGQIFDGYCGEPVGWGFKIVRHLGDARFNALSEYGDVEHVGDYFSGSWALILEWLTPDKALEKYGDITSMETGPRGGFRNATYGHKTFMMSILDPRRRRVIGTEEKTSTWEGRTHKYIETIFGEPYVDIDYKTDPRVKVEL